MSKLLKIKTFDYEDVVLIPKKGVVKSRSEVNVTQELGGHRFNLPVIPANMSTVIDEELAIKLAEEGFFYVMHRFDVDPVEFIDRTEQEGVISSISFGTKDYDYEVLATLKKMGKMPDYITVDVAHGYSQSASSMISSIREVSPQTFIIGGNVATPEGGLFLEAAGADAVKVGIGPGKACLSTMNTGFGTRGWQLSAVEQVADRLLHADTIADGGIQNYGDIAKSIVFGADFVMMGRMLAGHEESPGKLVIDEDGEEKKEYFGSASEFQKGNNKHIEGKKLHLEPKGSIFSTLQTIKENLQSAVSYAGGRGLIDLRQVEYVEV